MPKCTVSTPSALAMGTSRGVSNKIADNGSRKQPTINNRTLTTSRNCQGVTSRYLIQETSVAGTWLTVRSQGEHPRARHDDENLRRETHGRSGCLDDLTNRELTENHHCHESRI